MFKRLSKGQQTAVAKYTHNIWHTGTRHSQYYGGAKPCCVCNCDAEYWCHVITFGSLDSALHWEASWEKLRKSMERWHLHLDFWKKIEKGINNYK
jgi:hypothetical protein